MGGPRFSQDPDLRHSVHGRHGVDGHFAIFRLFTEESVVSASSVYKKRVLSTDFEKTIVDEQGGTFQAFYRPLPVKTLRSMETE